jgi:hypothetical protein
MLEQMRRSIVFMAPKSYHGDKIEVIAAPEGNYGFRRTSVPAMMSWRACFFAVKPAMM